MADDGRLSVARPFPGLRPFGFADRDFFFGREEQVYALYRLLELSRFVSVIGSSGSGKSSLVRAGLLPLLAEETAGSGSRKWRTIVVTPGDAPTSRLAQGLLSLAPADDDEAARRIRGERIERQLRRSSFGLSEALEELPGAAGRSVLIVVDQFEELFRYASTATASDRANNARWRDEATNFVQLLLEATRGRQRGLSVLITMRSDFIGDCAQFHELPEAVSNAQFLTPSLTRDQREDAIRKPLEVAGAAIEPALVERLLNDVGTESDQLPVMQHCLLRVWDRAGADARDGARTLEMRHYVAIGTMSGALSQHANEVMASLAGRELVVEQVFRALSEVDKEGRATRRALPYARLLAETGVAADDLCAVLDRFRAPDCSFLLPTLAAVPSLEDDSRIDVVHEALLRRWDRISADRDASVSEKRGEAGWLAAEDADGRLYRALLALIETAGENEHVTLPLDQVESRTKWWRSRPRTAAWAERYGGRLPRVEQLFADSGAQLDADRARARRDASERNAARRQRAILAFVVPALVLALVGVAFALWQTHLADIARDRARVDDEIATRLRIQAQSEFIAAERARRNERIAQERLRMLEHAQDEKRMRQAAALAKTQEANALAQARLAADARKEAAAARAAKNEADFQRRQVIVESHRAERAIAAASAADAEKKQADKVRMLQSDESYSEGIAAMRAKDYDGAIHLLTTALLLDHGDAQSYAARGYAHYENGENALAIQDERSALALDPKSALAWYRLGLALENEAHYSDALRALNEELTLDKKDGGGYFLRGEINENLRRYDQSIADFTSALQIDGTDESAYIRRAEARQLEGDYDGAFLDVGQALKLKPNDNYAYRTQAILEFAKSDYTSAASDLQKAVLIEPDEIYGLLWLQLVSFKVSSDVNPDFARLSAPDRKNWPHPVARLFLGTEKIDDVLAEAAKVVQPDNGPMCEADFYGGEYLLSHGDAARGAELIREAAARCPAGYLEYRAALAEVKRLPT
jgi:lipoprotein NlpI/energy-coupling factor transporter ATP-binding protein EcfA2